MSTCGVWTDAGMVVIGAVRIIVKISFIKGYMMRNDDFIGVKIKATIAKMIGSMSQKYGRCGTWSKFVICIYMWITKASKNTKNTIIGLRTKQAGGSVSDEVTAAGGLLSKAGGSDAF
nr:hypothetical protein [Tanacetum cinerariifolium]